MPIDADAAASVEATPAGGRRDAATRAIAVVHVSASSPFRRWPLPAFVATDRRAGGAARIAASSSRRGRLNASAADGVIDDAREPAAGRRSRPRARLRRLFAGRASRAARSERRVHRRRQRSAAHRGDDAACRLSRSSARRRPSARRRGGSGAFPAELIEVDGLAVPAVRPARLRAGRFPLPDAHRRPRGHRRGRTAAGGRTRRSRAGNARDGRSRARDSACSRTGRGGACTAKPRSPS